MKKHVMKTSEKVEIWNKATEWDGTQTLARCTVVRATKDFDQGVTDVAPGDEGFVFGETDCYGDGAGPIVYWFKGVICNVYPEMCKVVWWNRDMEEEEYR